MQEFYETQKLAIVTMPLSAEAIMQSVDKLEVTGLDSAKRSKILAGFKSKHPGARFYLHQHYTDSPCILVELQ